MKKSQLRDLINKYTQDLLELEKDRETAIKFGFHTQCFALYCRIEDKKKMINDLLSIING